MKMKIIIFVALISTFSLVLTKSNSKKLRESKKQSDNTVIRGSQSMNTHVPHISEMIVGNPNTMVKDRSPMWKDFKDNRFDRPFMHGVVGPQWNVPVAEESNGFNLISSPMPKSDMSERVIANDLPVKTYSPTSFDMPLRKDVLQTEIPSSVTRTFETNIDPRNPPKKAVTTVHGVLYHGTSSTDPKIIHGIETNFLEKSISKKVRKSNKKSKKDFDLKSAQKAKEEGLNAAKNTYENSSALLNSITNNVAPSPHVVLNASAVNKREHPDIKLHENNPVLKKRIEDLRKTPAGVRAAHTPRRLGF